MGIRTEAGIAGNGAAAEVPDVGGGDACGGEAATWFEVVLEGGHPAREGDPWRRAGGGMTNMGSVFTSG